MGHETGKELSVQHKKILKVLFFTRDDAETLGIILKGDAIEHEGHLWLVQLWLESKDEGWSTPVRLVCLSAPPMKAQLQKMGKFEDADFLLNYPVPIGDLRNEAPPQTDHEFVVIERPSLRIARLH